MAFREFTSKTFLFLRHSSSAVDASDVSVEDENIRRHKQPISVALVRHSATCRSVGFVCMCVGRSKSFGRSICGWLAWSWVIVRSVVCCSFVGRLVLRYRPFGRSVNVGQLDSVGPGQSVGRLVRPMRDARRVDRFGSSGLPPQMYTRTTDRAGCGPHQASHTVWAIHTTRTTSGPYRPATAIYGGKNRAGHTGWATAAGHTGLATPG